MPAIVVMYMYSELTQVDGISTVPYATDRSCFMNFLRIFGQENLTINLDKCSDATVSFVQSECPNATTRVTTFGSESLVFLDLLTIVDSLDDNVIVYFASSQIMHAPTAPAILIEGLTNSVNSCYVTGIDSRDKYINTSSVKNGVPGGPLVWDQSEACRVYSSPSSHFRTTSSTGLYIMSTASSFKADNSFFKLCLTNYQDVDRFTRLWTTIRNRVNRIILCSLPGVSSLILSNNFSPYVDWPTIMAATNSS